MVGVGGMADGLTDNVVHRILNASRGARPTSEPSLWMLTAGVHVLWHQRLHQSHIANRGLTCTFDRPWFPVVVDPCADPVDLDASVM